jgi:hypothetical protein
MTVDAGIFHAEDISLPADISFDGNLSRLFRIEKELVLRIIDHFGIQLSPQQREEILVIPTENMVAFMSYCQGLEALDNGDYSLARKYFMESLRYDPNFIMAQDYFMEPDIWAATQNSNLIRVDREISQFIKTTPKGRVRLAYKPSPPLISPISRLSRMGLYQNACFLPGNDSRESFQEARLSGAPVVPEILGTPPLPPGVE